MMQMSMFRRLGPLVGHVEAVTLWWRRLPADRGSILWLGMLRR